jgi:putative spermidine/putrescine transport system permease protein
MLRVGVLLIYLFILGPIIVTAAVSFNSGNQSKFPPIGFSLQWWGNIFDPRWIEPLLFSLRLAVLSTFASLALGVPLAFGVTRYRFPGRNAIIALSLSPLILPALVTGIGLLLVLQLLGLGGLFGLPALLIGHVIICSPFVVRMTIIGISTLPPRVEDAALSLGATRLTVLREITLPLIKSGVFAGGTFAFIQSFTDYSVSLFLSSAENRPITLTILNFMEFGFTPTLAAVAVVTLIIPLVLLIAVQRFFNIGDFIFADSARR